MKKKTIKKLLLVSAVVGVMLSTTACRKPYDTPELVTVEPSQTAFLINLVGDAEAQDIFKSQDLLAKAKVASKEVQIPHRWVQTGRRGWQGEWRDSARLLLVERKPETREWTESNSTGTSASNQGIVAESSQSIGFMARMNISAQIDESDAVKFLYRYNSKSLAQILDTEIRASIETAFVEKCSKMTMEQIIVSKEAVMKEVRDKVIPTFKDRGINITVLGLKGDLTYNNPAIQESIDKKFKSINELEAQKTENERILSKAKADAEAIAMQQATIEKSLKLRELENQSEAIKKWDGKLPQYMTGKDTMMSIPIK